MKNNSKEYGGLKTFILSLVFAIAIWVVVGFAIDPDIRHDVTSLPIHYTGTTELADKGLVIIAPQEKNTAKVVVSGKRNDLIKYSDELYISVDVSGISSPGEYSMKGAAQLVNSRISIVRERIGDINIVVEPRDEKEIEVEIKQTGSLKTGLIKAMPQLEKLKVCGAKSEISSLSKAVITLDISKISEASTIYSDFKLCDENGNVLSKALTLTPEAQSIAVDLEVYEKKSLPIKLKLSDGLSDKYIIDTEKSTLDKTSIEAGVLSGYEVECVYAEVSEADNKETEISLIEEEGMYIPEESRRVKVRLQLIPVKSRHMDVTVFMENLGEGLEADFSSELTGVLIYAPEEVLNSEDFRLVTDLDGLEKGKHKVKVTATDDRVRIAEEIFVDVNIR